MEIEEIKPMIHLSTRELGEISEWENGNTYIIKMRVKQRSKTERQDEHGATTDSSFEVLEAEGKSTLEDGFDGPAYGG